MAHSRPESWLEHHDLKWAFRTFQDGDQSEALTLFQKAFGKTISREHYEWKLAKPKWSIPCSSIFFALDEEKLIGQYPGGIHPLKIGTRQEVVVHQCDTMTDPDYRKQGVLTDLGAAATRAWKDAGVPLIYGLPTDTWGSRSSFLGWLPCFEIKWMRKILRPGDVLRSKVNLPNFMAKGIDAISSSRIERQLSRHGNLSECRIEEVDIADSFFDQLWSSLKDAYTSMVVRDSSWIQYRYLDCPSADYQVLKAEADDGPKGFLVFRHTEIEGRSICLIADLFAHPNDHATYSALLNHCLRLCLNRSVTEMRIMLPSEGKLWTICRSHGYVPGRGHYKLHVVPLKEEVKTWPLFSVDDWHVTAGDFDVV